MLNSKEHYDIIVISQALLEPGTTRGGGVEEMNFNISLNMSNRFKIALVGPYYGEYMSEVHINNNLSIKFVRFSAIKKYPPKSKQELYRKILLSTPIYLPLLFIKIIELMDVSNKNQLFQVHNGPPGLLATIVAKIFRRKLVYFEGTLNPWVTSHAENPYESIMTKLINTFNLRAGIFIGKMSNCIIVQSESIKSSMICHKINESKIFVISGGVGKFRKDNDLIAHADVSRIGFIGRLSSEKGAALLFEVILMALKELPHIRFIIMGDGPYHKKFENLPNVEHLGWVTKDQLYEMLSRIKIVLFFQRAIGLAELEAMASGKVVIACNSGEVPKTIRHLENGILCSPDATSYINAIKFILDNYILSEEIAKNAQKTAEDNFSWDTISRHWEELYDRCIIREF